MKKCNKCDEIRELGSFYKHKGYKDGHRNTCINCFKLERKNYRESTDCNLKYRSENKDYFKTWAKNKYHTDHSYRLSSLLRKRLNRAIKGNYKVGSAVKDLGCSVEELKEYLQSKFIEGMSWDNYGEWHIDHIKPLASFDLNNKEEFKMAVHYTNLQPLWAKENLKKGKRF